jgi:hypothetical protein
MLIITYEKKSTYGVKQDYKQKSKLLNKQEKIYPS